MSSVFGLAASGIVTPLDRKRQIYELCQEYGIIIIEDDAYYYLQYPSLQGSIPVLPLLFMTFAAQKVHHVKLWVRHTCLPPDQHQATACECWAACSAEWDQDPTSSNELTQRMLE